MFIFFFFFGFSCVEEFQKIVKIKSHINQPHFILVEFV